MLGTLAAWLFCGALLVGGQVPGAGPGNRPDLAHIPPADEIWYSGIHQDSKQEVRLLKGDAYVQTSDLTISADEIDYNSDSQWILARGHVHLDYWKTGEKINADHGEFNLQTEEGKFYQVDGTAPAKIMTNPAVLSTTNPFYFRAAWVDRIKNRYILHQGFVTDCKVPKPWWMFQAPTFDIIPGDRAIGRNTVFRLKHVPIFYLPFFRRPLGRNPRQSGFLTPNFGHSTLFGYIYGLGYYWAINRSYDMTGVVQYLTLRGPSFQYDFRGKPNQVTDFNFSLYGVNDRGVPSGQTVEKQGGVQFELTARTQLGGFNGRVDYNYLSSYLFRQAFSYSFAGLIQSEVDSIGLLQRRYAHDRYTLNLVAQRNQLFESITLLNQTPNQVVIQKLPSIEFGGRDQELVHGPVPVWFSFQSSAALLTRSEPTGANTETTIPPAQILSSGPVGRIDIEPRVATGFRFAGFSLEPSLTLGAMQYTDSYSINQTTFPGAAQCGTNAVCLASPSTVAQLGNGSLFRKDADFVLDFRPPTIEKIFTPPKWMHLNAVKLKHVIEADATYEYVTGINQFNNIIHFDSTDILSNTNQLTVSLTNRIYKKNKNGNVSEVVTWKVAQQRYFDPTFGGAVLPDVRNVVLATEEFTPFAFLNGPRTYSPVTSWLTFTPYTFLALDWRADFDPLYRKIIADTYSAGMTHGKYFARASETSINTTDRKLLPQANQITFSAGYGNTNRRGWNVGGLVDYDLIAGQRLYDFIQSSYNTDCCGFSFQIRQYNLGIRNENQFLFSFSVANLGTFGSLQRQERIF